MKINSVEMNPAYLKGKVSKDMHCNARGNAHVNCDLAKMELYDKINTTAGEKFGGRLSFKGGPVKTPPLHKIANFVYKDPLLGEAIFATLLTCILRPLTILALARTDEQKEKCSYQAGKSISSGAVGLVTTFMIGTPIKNAVAKAIENGSGKIPTEVKQAQNAVVEKAKDALKMFVETQPNGKDAANVLKNFDGFVKGEAVDGVKVSAKSLTKEIKKLLPKETSKEILKGVKAQKAINNYSNTVKNVSDKFLEPIVMILRAKITIALVPLLVSLIFVRKKSVAKSNAAADNTVNVYNMLQNANKNNVFSTLLGDFGNEN